MVTLPTSLYGESSVMSNGFPITCILPLYRGQQIGEDWVWS